MTDNTTRVQHHDPASQYQESAFKIVPRDATVINFPIQVVCFAAFFALGFAGTVGFFLR